MDSQSLTQLNQIPAEAQLRVLEIVLQIVTLSTLVLFAVSVVIIIWLCLLEPRLARPGSPYVQVVKDENAGIPAFTDPLAGNTGIYSCATVFSPWYATWARRMYLRLR